jgi:L-alanine-DL-glutamate epimerase-like enolase superfamily enzyme
MNVNKTEALKIVKAQSYLLEVPVPLLHIDSQSDISAWHVLAVCLRSETGHEGWGYQSGFGPVMGALRQFLEADILPAIIGKDAADHKRWWSEIYLLRHHLGLNGPAIQGISAPEVAAWDLVARASEVPLWKLLGGRWQNKILCYNTNVGWLGFSQDELIDNVKRAMDVGFRGVKVKIGSPSFSTDIKRLEALRGAVGSEILISVDVNNRWDLQTALQCAPLLADFDVAWLEEPIHPFDVHGHAAFAAAVSTPLLHGENIYEPLMFRDMLKAGGMGIAQPSNMKLGGISKWLQVASIAQSEGKRIVPAGWTMMQIDQHLAAATSNCWMVEWIPWIKDIFTDPVLFDDGYITVSDAPGASTRIRPELLG